MSTSRSSEHLSVCHNCGVRSPRNYAYCPACGAALDTGSSRDEFQPVALESLLESCHQTLLRAGTEAAEYAFGISCSLGLLASAVLSTLFFLVISRAWTGLTIAALMAVLISLIIANFLALRSRQATFRTTYQRKIRSQIDQFIRENSLERGEVHRRAGELLPPDSPLLRLITEDDLLT